MCQSWPASFAPIGLPAWWILVLTRIFGVPVIAARAAGVVETCGDAARYFDPYDVRDIGEALIELLLDRDLDRGTGQRQHHGRSGPGADDRGGPASAVNQRVGELFGTKPRKLLAEPLQVPDRQARGHRQHLGRQPAAAGPHPAPAGAPAAAREPGELAGEPAAPRRGGSLGHLPHQLGDLLGQSVRLPPGAFHLAAWSAARVFHGLGLPPRGVRTRHEGHATASVVWAGEIMAPDERKWVSERHAKRDVRPGGAGRV